MRLILSVPRKHVEEAIWNSQALSALTAVSSDRLVDVSIYADVGETKMPVRAARWQDFA